MLLISDRNPAQVFSLQQQTDHKLLYLKVRPSASRTSGQTYHLTPACAGACSASRHASSLHPISTCCFHVQEHVLKGDQPPTVLIGHSIGMGTTMPGIGCIPS